MNESLEQMITNYNPEEENEEEEQETTNDNNSEVEENVEPIEANEAEVNNTEANYINITNFSLWFRQNVQNFDNIFSVNASLRGVDPNENLIMTVKDQNDTTGETRYPYVFRGATNIPVLNLQGNNMFIYQNNTFQINYNYSDNIFIKTYNLRRGIGIVYCLIESQNSNPVPVKIERYKKFNQNSIQVPDISNIPIEEILNREADLESIIIRYKQLQKFRDDISTNRDVVNFFIDRQSKIYDINHLIQIDEIVSSIFN